MKEKKASEWSGNGSTVIEKETGSMSQEGSSVCEREPFVLRNDSANGLGNTQKSGKNNGRDANIILQRFV